MRTDVVFVHNQTIRLVGAGSLKEALGAALLGLERPRGSAAGVPGAEAGGRE